MKTKKILLTGVIVAFIASSAGVFYSKSVRAAQLEKDLELKLQNDDYQNAGEIYREAGKDIVISKVFNFPAIADKLLTKEYTDLKAGYLADSITYKDFRSKVDILNKLNFFHETENERQAIEKIEAFRENYRTAEAYAGDKDYAGAVKALNEIGNLIDPAYKSKLDNLKTSVLESARKDTDTLLNGYVDKGNYPEAIALLESKKELLAEDYITEKTNYVNSLIAKKKDEDELKRKAEEEAKKKVSAAMAQYLKGYVSNPDKENAVSAISSRTNFLVWVDIPTQTTNVFVGKKGSWMLIRSFTSSTGKSGADTPSGTYTIKDRGTWFFSSKYQEGAKYWVRFSGNYLFHSLPMNEEKQVVDPTLGSPASHGCVRLSLDEASWFYNNIPAGTTVYIK